MIYGHIPTENGRGWVAPTLTVPWVVTERWELLRNRTGLQQEAMPHPGWTIRETFGYSVVGGVLEISTISGSTATENGHGWVDRISKVAVRSASTEHRAFPRQPIFQVDDFPVKPGPIHKAISGSMEALVPVPRDFQVPWAICGATAMENGPGYPAIHGIHNLRAMEHRVSLRQRILPAPDMTQ